VNTTALLVLGGASLVAGAVFVVYWCFSPRRARQRLQDQTKGLGIAAGGTASNGRAESEDSWPSLANEMAVAWLVVADGPEPGAHHMVVHGTNLIGRGSSCDIRLTDPAVSRRHARLLADGDRFLLYDLQSTSGTYVDGKEVDPSAAAPIEDGAAISMGSTELIFSSVHTKPRS
jgi:hypothetical protein